ncbi:MAG: copper resistance protein CopC, partial [Ilumatobacteraceae bacterium]
MNEAPLRPARRRLSRTTVVAAIALGVVGIGSLVGPGVVHADATVVSSDPADGSTIATSPTEISIVFSEELGTEANTVSLSGNAEVVTLGRPEVGDDGLTLTIPVPSALPKGTCVANWLVSDVDGAPNGNGAITFNVSTDPVVTTTTVDPATAASTATTLATTTAVDPNAAASAPTDVVSPTEAETGQGPL